METRTNRGRHHQPSGRLPGSLPEASALGCPPAPSGFAAPTRAKPKRYVHSGRASVSLEAGALGNTEATNQATENPCHLDADRGYRAGEVGCFPADERQRPSHLPHAVPALECHPSWAARPCRCYRGRTRSLGQDARKAHPLRRPPDRTPGSRGSGDRSQTIREPERLHRSTGHRRPPVTRKTVRNERTGAVSRDRSRRPDSEPRSATSARRGRRAAGHRNSRSQWRRAWKVSTA